MKKIYLLIFVFGFISLQAQDVNITFNVNMGETADFIAAEDSVWVVMDGDEDWNFTEYYGMEDPEADGIYTYTLTVASGGTEVVQQYSFGYGPTADAWKDWETPPPDCANESDYREITLPADQGDTIPPAFYYATCSDVLGGAIVTFQVDMSDVGDLAGAVWFNVNGDWSDWYDMTDAGGGIYTVTTAYNPGDVVFYTYGYQNGPDPDINYVDEVVPEACGGTFGVRRYVVGPADATVPVVKFNACPTELPELVEITFSVDMSNEAVGEKLVWQVIKSPWYWNQLSLSGDDIYVGKVKAHKGQSFPYTFLLGDQDEWSGEESVPEDCNYGSPTAPERLFEGAMQDSVMPVITFGQCADVSDKYTITFRVDMSGVADIYENGYVWVNLDNWTNWYDMTDDDADMVYEFDAKYSEGEVVNYIFSYQNGADPNVDYVDETVPEACATDGQRVYTVGTADAVLEVLSFGSCSLDTWVNDQAEGQLKLYPNPAVDQLTIELKDVSSGTMTIRDLSGREVISCVFSNANELNLSVGHLIPEMYIVTIITENQTYRDKLLVR